MSEIIEVLVVDDSLIYRKSIEKALTEIPDVQVIGSVWNGKKAIEFIEKKNIPDLITLDVEMPEMDGIETLQKIQELIAQNNNFKKIKIIMVSTLTHEGAEITIRALQLGAYDFIPKPRNSTHAENIGYLKSLLIEKIKSLKGDYVFKLQSEVKNKFNPVVREYKDKQSKKIKAVAIGVSTGGPKALMELLPVLCDKINVPVFIVQHMPPEFTSSLANNLNQKCSYNVIEAQNEDMIKNDHIYISPGGMHLIVRHNATGQVITAMSNNPPENGSKPSVNVLFRSLTNVYGGNIIAIILTGMGTDGTKSLSLLKRSGAYIIAQDKETSIVWGMPGSAVSTGYVDEILPLAEIPYAVEKIVSKL